MQSISNKCFVEYCSLDRQLALRYLGYRGQYVDDALLDEFERIVDYCARGDDAVSSKDAFDVVRESLPAGSKDAVESTRIAEEVLK